MLFILIMVKCWGYKVSPTSSAHQSVIQRLAMIWFPVLVGALMVGGSLGKSLSQRSDITGLDKTSPESSAMKYYITGIRDEKRHWTEEVKMEHGDEDWHVDVDHATLEEEQGQPKVKITATFSAAKPKTPDVKGEVEVEVKKDTGYVFQLFPRSERKWFDADIKCEEWGGHLAIPDTKEKLHELTRILRAHIKETGVTTGAFLGFNDLKEEGTFVTVLGKPMFSTQDSAWSPPWYRSDQPDDDKSKSTDGEDCGLLMSSGGLNDVPCTDRMPFICERATGINDAVDEGETTTLAETGDENEDSLRLFSQTAENWYSAKKACVTWGGHLAIPDSEEKMKKMTKMLNSPRKNPEKMAAFLGFNDIKKEGDFVTIFDKPLFGSQGSSYSPPWYRSDQPDDAKTWSKDGEDCGSLRPSGGLNDVPCRSYSLFFICEKPQGIKKAVDKEESTNPATPATVTPAETAVDDKESLRLFPMTGRNWFEARKACIEWGGDLAIPDSKEKIETMTQMLNSPAKNPDMSGAFLGFHDLWKEGEFVTIFGKPVFSSNGQWSPHWFESAQPDDSKVWTTDGEDCGSMRPNGGLNDVPCRYHLPYFCEKSSEIDNPKETEDDYGHPGENGHTPHPFEEEGSTWVNDDEDDD